MYGKDVDLTKVKEFLPTPQGYHILVAIPHVEEKSKGGIVKPDELRAQEEMATIVGMVVSLGKDAYKDGNKFPNGAYCEEGDWVVFRSYTGTRLRINGQQFRVINDDTVEATVPDPRMINRAY